MSRVVGIDPGVGGAVACLDGYGELCWVDDMPVTGKQVSPYLLDLMLADAFDGLMYGSDAGSFVVAVVERAQNYPKMGGSGAFNYGTNYGIILGVLAASDIRTEHVPPNRWKRAMRLSADKEMARKRAIERWPGHAELFKRKKDADRAEAALIALWWIEHEEAKPKESP